MSAEGDAGVGRVIVRNVGYLAGGYTATRLLQLLFFLVISVYLGETDTGLFSVLLSAATLAAIAADAGLDQVVTRELARRRGEAGAIVPALLALRCALCVPVALGLLLYVASAPGLPRDPLLWAAAAWLTIATTGLIYFRAVLRAFDRMDAEAASGVIERLAVVGAGWTVLALGGGPRALLGALAGATTLALIYAWRTVGHDIAAVTVPRIDVALWKRYLRLALPFLLTGATVELLHRIDVQMLQWLAGAAENGRYYVAYRVVEGAFLLPQILAVAMLPQLSIQHGAGGLDARLVRRAVRLLLAASLPLAVAVVVAFAVVAPWVGETWVQAVPTVACMAWMIPPVYANYALGTALAAMDRQRWNLVAALIALAVNVALNLTWIPLWGAWGAAAAVAVGQAVYTLGLAVFTARASLHVGLADTAARAALAGAVAAWIVPVWYLAHPGTVAALGTALIWLTGYTALAWALGLARFTRRAG